MRTNVTGIEDAIRALSRVGEKGEKIASEEIVRSALTVQRGAKREAPVDTGRLRNSITVAPTERELASRSDMATDKAEPPPMLISGMLSAVIGTNVEYAEKVHFGGLRRPGRQFLRNPFEREKPQLLRRLRAQLRRLEDA